MFTKKLLLAVTVFFFTSFLTIAQDKDTVIVENEEGVNDTIYIEDKDWNDDSESTWEGRDWKDDMNWDFDLGDFHGKPAISLNYGFSELKRDDINFSFPKPNLIEGKLGYMSERSEWNDDVVEYSYRYFRLANFSTELSQNKDNGPGFESNMWRFGIGRESGFGWRFGESAIIPYNSYSMDWTRVEFKGLPDYSNGIIFIIPSDYINNVDVLNRYNKTFRFGTSTEAGIKFRIIGGLTIEGAYERSIVFERHLFWKWAGSAVIEAAAQGLLDSFINEVGESSPYVAPIINFVLKNALSYGIYELRQEKMNWPFNSAPPLSYDQFKVGMSFVF